jgi:hypothetical protein
MNFVKVQLLKNLQTCVGVHPDLLEGNILYHFT